MQIDSGLLAILACPACHAPLRVDESVPDRPELACTGCGLAYPVRDDIPVLLVDEARRPDPEPDPDPAPEPGPDPDPGPGADPA